MTSEARGGNTSEPRALDESDELWIRLVWLTRLRWIVPVALLVGFRAVDHWVGHLAPAAPGYIIVAGLLALNGVYAALLRRWRRAPREHQAGLEAMAHAQVAVDLVLDAAAVFTSGGAHSAFWPIFMLTMLVAALFFPRRSILCGYGLAAVALWFGVSWVDLHALHAPNGFLLAAMIVVEVGIVSFYSQRVERVHDLALELERLRAEKTAAEEVARKKDLILSTVSHELRNPLTALRGFVDLARMMKSSTPAQPLDKTLGRIDAQVERMTRLVSDLYDLSSARAGQLRLQPRVCDLVALVRELVERFHTLDPSLRIDLDAPQASWGQWDPERIDQLVTNLVGNAVKYAGRSPIVVRLVPASGQSVHLEVSDEGPGIPPDKLPRIFEAFVRLDERGRQTGLGLGLSIAREIASLHGGAIWVDSEPGRGTTFHVRLPTGGIRPPS